MQIDFHHGATYVIARLAGFDADDALTVAYAAQYVDDATNSGVVKFDNDALYARSCTTSCLAMGSARPEGGSSALIRQRGHAIWWGSAELLLSQSIA